MDQPVKELKIVIVEDNTALADIYKIRLELIGYKCFVAYDGEAALDIIEREMPDLVLLDMMVPKIAGDEILRRMRASDWGKDIRVFVISNLDEVDAPKGLRDLGIEGYVVKANLSNDQLDQLVDNILKPKGQTESTSLETPSSSMPDGASEAEEKGDDNTYPVFESSHFTSANIQPLSDNDNFDHNPEGNFASPENSEPAEQDNSEPGDQNLTNQDFEPPEAETEQPPYQAG